MSSSNDFPSKMFTDLKIEENSPVHKEILDAGKELGCDSEEFNLFLHLVLSTEKLLVDNPEKEADDLQKAMERSNTPKNKTEMISKEWKENPSYRLPAKSVGLWVTEDSKIWAPMPSEIEKPDTPKPKEIVVASNARSSAVCSVI